MVAGTTYNFTIDLATTNSTLGGITPGCIELQVWGNMGGCNETELLWSSGNVTSLTWQTYNVTFTPSHNYTHILFIEHNLGCTTNPYIMMDNMSAITPVVLVSQFTWTNTCQGSTMQFTDSSTTPTGTINSWSWNFGDSSTSTLQNPSHVYTTAGTYNVTLTVTNTLSCTATVTHTVTIYPLPSFTIAPTNPSIYYGNSVTLFASGSGTNTYQWAPTTGLLDTTGATVIAKPTNTTTYTVTATSTNNCTATNEVTIFVYPLGDPDLILSFDNENMDCNSSTAYFQFDIMAASTPNTIFNSCVIDLSYTPDEFGTNIADSVLNYIQNGSDFPNSIYPVTVSDYSSNIIEITFGDNTVIDSTDGTIISSTPETLLSIKIPIVGCNPSSINFTNTATTISNSFYINSTETSAGDYTYTVETYTTTDYPSVGFNATTCPFQIMSIISSLDPADGALAGTSDIVTINGSGFGNSRTNSAGVFLTDANKGSNFPLDTSDFINWSDNEIDIKLPSIMFDSTSCTPGSGTLTLSNPCGNITTSNLNVYYNVINGSTTNQKLKTNIVREQGSPGSFLFRCDTSITHNAAAYACVKKAISHWNCVTGVNWVLGQPDSLVNRNAADNVCVIYFSNIDAFPALATTRQHPLPCFTSDAFISDADIAIEKDLSSSVYYPGIAWSYDTTGSTPPFNEYSFYQNILHELGHVHQLNHVNDINDLMYRGMAAGGAFRDITTWPSSDQAAAKNVIDSSMSVIITPCIYVQMHNTADPCSSLGLSTYSTSEYQLLNVYPNPSNNGNLTISYILNINSFVQFKIVDYTGKEILNLKDEYKTAGIYSEQVNISELAAGIYLFIANINGEYQSIKLIKI